MIAICESTRSERTKALRKKFYAAGFPCITETVRNLKEYRPIELIVTYYEQFDQLRHGPYDDIFALVIGSGFVNSALHAVRVKDEDEAVRVAGDYLFKKHGMRENQILQSGIISKDGIFFSKRHFEICGNIIYPTVSEYMIFKYLYCFAETERKFSTEQIRRFCYARSLGSQKNLDGNIAVHVANLNHKITETYGVPLIHARRYQGYYFDYDRL